MGTHDDRILTTLGIDPGTRVTGYGIVKKMGARFQAIDFGTIRPPANGTFAERYLVIFEGVTTLIEKFKPSAVAVETQYVHKNVQSAIKLGMARGVVLVASARQGVPVFEYSPSQAKRAVVGNGRASKEQVQAMVQALLCLSELPTPNDAADALALAICHLQRAKQSIAV